MGKGAYVISPVRHLTVEQQEFLHDWMLILLQSETADIDRVYLPFEHTYQGAELGGVIQCFENRAAIEEADIVYIFWTGDSEGGIFDLGMAFALRKPLVVIKYDVQGNKVEHKYEVGEKSFENLMWAWERGVM